jgi:hypothetical protein
MNDRLRHRRVARARICIGLVVCAAAVLVAMVWVTCLPEHRDWHH